MSKIYQILRSLVCEIAFMEKVCVSAFVCPYLLHFQVDYVSTKTHYSNECASNTWKQEEGGEKKFKPLTCPLWQLSGSDKLCQRWGRMMSGRDEYGNKNKYVFFAPLYFFS